MVTSNKTVPELRKPENPLRASTNLEGRHPPGLCATVLSNGQILMGYSSPNGTVTPGFTAVALGSQFQRG
jgi:hypothetical protein